MALLLPPSFSADDREPLLPLPLPTSLSVGKSSVDPAIRRNLEGDTPLTGDSASAAPPNAGADKVSLDEDAPASDTHRAFIARALPLPLLPFTNDGSEPALALALALALGPDLRVAATTECRSLSEQAAGATGGFFVTLIHFFPPFGTLPDDINGAASTAAADRYL